MRRSIASSPGNARLLLGADGVDVAGLGQRRQPDLELAGALEELVDDEPGACLAFLGDDLVERREPVLGLVRVDVRQLVLELVEIHACRQRERGRRRGLASADADVCAGRVSAVRHGADRADVSECGVRRTRTDANVTETVATASDQRAVRGSVASIRSSRRRAPLGTIRTSIRTVLVRRHADRSLDRSRRLDGPSPCHVQDTAGVMEVWSREHPAARPRRRRRTPDHEARLDRPGRGRLPRRHRRGAAKRRWPRPRRSGRTSSCSTSSCPTSMASRSCASSASGGRSRSSC